MSVAEAINANAKASHERAKQEKEFAWKKYTKDIALCITYKLIIISACLVTMKLNLVANVIAIPIMIICLAIICFKSGEWYGKRSS